MDPTASSSGGSNVQGTINYTPYFAPPFIPPILAEWTSLIPLVSHLTSYQDDYQLIGRAALAGRLHVSFFPRLGMLHGIAGLLGGGPDFLDRLSSISQVSNSVWDINGGNTFPCANGAASEIITAYALRQQRSDIHRMPEDLPPALKWQSSERDASVVVNSPQNGPCNKQSPGNMPSTGMQAIVGAAVSIIIQTHCGCSLRVSPYLMDLANTLGIDTTDFPPISDPARDRARSTKR